MQTMYFETSSFIRHEGNLVDLAAYRRKLSAVSGESWAPRFEEASEPEPEAREVPRLTVLPTWEARTETPRAHRTRRGRRLALALDLCASLAVIALTVCAALSFLQL